MIDTTPTLELLARAIDVSALRQSVYASNVANAGVAGYARMEVTFDQALERMNLQTSSAQPGFASGAWPDSGAVSVVATGEAVKLDEEIARMAKNALRYQVLLEAFERSTGSLRLAIREGRE
jgi:flagellar basal-body rod protein FlgB